MRVVRAALGFALAVVALTTTACGIEHDRDPPSRVAVRGPGTCPPTAAELGLLRGQAGDPGGLIPEEFTPVTVVRCLISNPPADESPGQTRYRVEEHHAAWAPAIGPALALPDRVDSNAVCTLEGRFPDYVLLVDASGAGVHVRLPQDVCGRTRAATDEALASLDLETVRTYDVVANG